MKKLFGLLVLMFCLSGAFAEYRLTGEINKKQNAYGRVAVLLFTDSDNNNDKVYQTALITIDKEMFIIEQSKDLKEAIIVLNEYWELFSMDDCRDYTLQRLREAATSVECCDVNNYKYIFYYLE